MGGIQRLVEHSDPLVMKSSAAGVRSAFVIRSSVTNDGAPPFNEVEEVQRPLAQELEMIDNYLAIEQVRFADRLKVKIAVEPSALDGLVPCFLLQPIVENAIVHGIAPSINEGMVVASARREGSTLHLRVRDTGSDLSAPAGRTHNGHGIGLHNTRERLLHFYQDAFEMRAEPLIEGGFEVAISIPFEPASR